MLFMRNYALFLLLLYISITSSKDDAKNVTTEAKAESQMKLPVPIPDKDEVNYTTVKSWADKLGEELKEIIMSATRETDILKEYQNDAKVVEIDPENEIEEMKAKMEEYLSYREELAYRAKTSLENIEIETNQTLWKDYNKYEIRDNKTFTDKNFVHYFNAKTLDNSANITHEATIPAEETLNVTRSPNFDNIAIANAYSAVHVPLPVYNRQEELLSRIKWSRLDKLFHSEREEPKKADVSWQFYCGKQGFLRFYPGREWPQDEGETDLFDCRNTEWYINGATNEKNVILLLDMSGSMLGQRFEIVKQAVEMILETLSENDFFNIITFNDQVKFLAPCFEDMMMQATLRNKWLMRQKLGMETKQEKIADFVQGLSSAFKTIRSLPPVNVTDRKNLPEGWRMSDNDFALTHGRVMLVPYDVNELNDSLPCNSAIMLLTDGATENFEKIFKKFNPDKMVRVFTFLVGDEATDFTEVKSIACSNKGYMNQLSNLADVQEKVQNYINVMSRALIDESVEQRKEPVWTGIYDERLFRKPKRTTQEKDMTGKVRKPENLKMVTTVAFPVLVNQTFEGVAGVAVPMDALIQMVPAYKLGVNSYPFIVDNNGYAMYHPQLRPFDITSGKGTYLKPYFNSIDILELEVVQGNKLTIITPDEEITKLKELLKARGGLSKQAEYYHRHQIYREGRFHNSWGLWTLRDNKTVDMDIDYTRDLRTDLVDGVSSKVNRSTPLQSDVLIAIDPGVDHSKMPVRRVYLQRNKYYYRGLNHTPFSLGLAVAQHQDVRVEPEDGKEINYTTDNSGEPQNRMTNWFTGSNWRVHPEWRYCFLNHTDFNVTNEAALKIYVAQMTATKDLPDRCNSRKDLVERLLFDAKMTRSIDAKWIKYWESDIKYEIHLIYFATMSGLTRYANIDTEKALTSISYTSIVPNKTNQTPTTSTPLPNSTESQNSEEKEKVEQSPPYLHYIHQRTRAVDELYFQRALKYQDDRYIFDLNLETWVYKKEQYRSAHGHGAENISLLVTAAKALYLDGPEYDSGNNVWKKKKAPIGVVGIEMLYDNFSKLVAQKSGNICGKGSIRCYLLDENGYVVHASNLTRYDVSKEVHRETAKRAVSYKELLLNRPAKPSPDTLGHAENPLGRFFGDLGSPEAKVMERFVEHNLYQEHTYVDYQAICNPNDGVGYAKTASRLLSPFYNLAASIHWLWNHAFYLIKEFGFYGLITSFLASGAEGYSPTFRGEPNGLPCDKVSYLYLLNTDTTGNEVLMAQVNGQLSPNGVCGIDDCSLDVFAAPVPHTNLVFTYMKMKAKNGFNLRHRCYSIECKKGYVGSPPGAEKPGPRFSVVFNASDKIQRPTSCNKGRRYRRKPGKCGKPSKNESSADCSGAENVVLSTGLAFGLSALYATLLRPLFSS